MARMYWYEQYMPMDRLEKSKAWYDFKLGTSVFLKHPGRDTWTLFLTVLRYDLFHVLWHLPKPGLTVHTGGWQPEEPIAGGAS